LLVGSANHLEGVALHEAVVAATDAWMKDALAKQAAQKQHLQEIVASIVQSAPAPARPQLAPADSDSNEWPAASWRGPVDRELREREPSGTAAINGVSAFEQMERREAAQRLEARTRAKYENPLERGLNWLRGR
jgi:hypothetical protein